MNNVASWIIFGTIAGIVADLSDRVPAKGGLWGSMAFGIAGAVLGGVTAVVLFSVNARFDLPSFIIAIAFSLFLIMIHRTLMSRPKAW